MEKSKLFQYAILFHPVEEKDGKKVQGKTTIIKDLTVIIAQDEKTAGILIAKQIPDEYKDKPVEAVTG